MEKVVLKKLIGKQIKRFRTLSNMSQEQLSEQLELSPRSMSAIETGKNFISLTKLSKLCTIMEIEPYQLFLAPKEEDSNRIEEINKILRVMDAKQLEIIYNMVYQLSLYK